MGHLTRKIQQRQQKNYLRGAGLNLIIFSVLVTLAALMRILTIYAVVVPDVCWHLRDMMLGSIYDPVDGPIDLTLWACLAAVILLLTLGANSMISIPSPKFSIFGSVNAALALLLAVYCTMFWAYFSPDHPLAEPFNSLGKYYQMTVIHLDQPTSPRPMLTDSWLNDEFGWKEVEPGMKKHIVKGLTAKLEETNSCFPVSMRREHIRVRGYDPYREGLVDLEDSDLTYTRRNWIFYDADGLMILPSPSITYQVHPPFYKKLQDARQNPSPINYFDLVTEFETAWATATSEPKQHTLSYDAILGIVEETSNNVDTTETQLYTTPP